jgi:hypothetical protein
MFPTKEDRLKQYEDELLEIYILIEKNNFQSCKEAAIRYGKLKGISNLSSALVEAKARYRIFAENL